MNNQGPADRLAWVRAAVEGYEGPLLRYAVRITRDLDRARDVVQETFLRLCREERSRVDGHLTEWLFTVCRSRALDMRRKESRMNSMSVAEVENCASRDCAPSVGLERDEAVSQVLAALGTLPENQQEVIRLKFQDGLSYREISGVTGLTVSNVGFLIHTGLKTVRQRLGVGAEAD